MQLPIRASNAEEHVPTDIHDEETTVATDDDHESVITQVDGQYDISFNLHGMPLANKYIHRAEEMDKIRQALIPKNAGSGRKIFVLRGLGGIGKTQLAVNFARLHHDEFTAVVWLDASSEQILKQSLASFACRLPEFHGRELDLKDNLDFLSNRTLSWLSETENKTWLLIFDSIDVTPEAQTPDTRGYDIKQYLPGADHGSILITTRLTRLEQLGTSLEVKKVGEQTAREMLESWYPSAQDDQKATSLLKRLDGLPLAIAQAGAYLNESGVTLETYLQLYETHWAEVAKSLDELKGPLEDYPNRSVWTTWTISFKAIRSKNYHAANLLMLWSYFSNKDLWFEIFTMIAEAKNTVKMLTSWIGDCCTDKSQFIKAMALLRSYSLIDDMTTGYSMHPVVHEWAFQYDGRTHLPDLGQLVLTVIGLALIANGSDDFKMDRRLLPHAQQCISRCSPILVKGCVVKNITASPSVREIATATLMAYRALGNLLRLEAIIGTEAELMCALSLEGCEVHHGPNHSQTLSAVVSLALAQRFGTDPVETKKLHLRAYRGMKDLGNESGTAVVANNLGVFYYTQYQFDEATIMYKEALNIDTRLRGPRHPSTISTKKNLANVYRETGKLEDAEKIILETLEVQREIFGDDNPHTLFTMVDLGQTYREQGRYGEAEECLTSILPNVQKTYHPEHIFNIHYMTCLGLVYGDQMKWQQAEEIYSKLVTKLEKLLGSEHTDTLIMLQNLASPQINLGNFESAETLLMRVIRAREKSLEPLHPQILSTYLSLGTLYKEQGKLEDAEAAYMRVMHGCEKIGRETHPDMAKATRNLGLVYVQREQFELAEAMYQRSIKIWKDCLGPEHGERHPRVLAMYSGLGFVNRTRNPELSKTMYLKALEGYKKVEGEDSANYLQLKNYLDGLKD